VAKKNGDQKSGSLNEAFEGLSKLEAQIGYNFTNKELLIRSMTHRSCAAELGQGEWVSDNERLEFLGDAILSFVSADILFKRESNVDEGVLSQLRAAYVCQANLAAGARNISLGQYLRVSKAMRAGGPVDLPSTLSDAVEALIAAVFLDGGLEASTDIIARILGPIPKEIDATPRDAKSLLQEKVQGVFGVTPTYEFTQCSGPPHDPLFEVVAKVEQTPIGYGVGKSKKLAATDCAAKILERMNDLSDSEIESLLKGERFE